MFEGSVIQNGDCRYLLVSRRYGLFGMGSDMEEAVGLMMARAAYEDTVYLLDQQAQRYAAFEKNQHGVQRLLW